MQVGATRGIGTSSRRRSFVAWTIAGSSIALMVSTVANELERSRAVTSTGP